MVLYVHNYSFKIVKHYYMRYGGFMSTLLQLITLKMSEIMTKMGFLSHLTLTMTLTFDLEMILGHISHTYGRLVDIESIYISKPWIWLFYRPRNRQFSKKSFFDP